MPTRWLTLLIVLFWLTTSVMLFRQSYWPYLQPNSPPPFAINLLDEASSPADVHWKVLHNGKQVLTAQTAIQHRPHENDFILRAVFKPFTAQPPNRPLEPQSMKIEGMTSEYRVNPEGQLLGLKVELAVTYTVIGLTKPPVENLVAVAVEGDVTNGQFAGRYQFEFQGIVHKGKLEPVPVAAQGSVLMPMHPVTYVRGLRPGQTWRVPSIDPLAALVPAGRPDSTLNAKVLRETQRLKWNGKEVDCLVIEYTNEEMSAHTWVRREDDVVLRQEVTLSGDTWVMEREW